MIHGLIVAIGICRRFPSRIKAMRMPLGALLGALVIPVAAFGRGPLAGPAAGAWPGDRPGPGPLIIAGGALRESNGALWRAFIREAEAHETMNPDGRLLLVIVPTASALDDAGSSAGAVLERYAPDAEIRIVEIRVANENSADDPEHAGLIRDADGVWFTGGDQSRITRVFRPDGPGSTMADRALTEAHARGAVIGGTSAGAAMMSRVMIAGGDSAGALIHGAGEGGVRIAPGMGLMPFGITDQHFFERDRLARLVVALMATGERYGIGIGENQAVLVRAAQDDPSRVWIECLGLAGAGDNGAMIVDIAGAMQDNGAIRNVRADMLLPRGSMMLDAEAMRHGPSDIPRGADENEPAGDLLDAVRQAISARGRWIVASPLTRSGPLVGVCVDQKSMVVSVDAQGKRVVHIMGLAIEIESER